MGINLARVAGAEAEQWGRNRLEKALLVSLELSLKVPLWDSLGNEWYRFQAWWTESGNYSFNWTEDEKRNILKEAYTMAYGDPQDTRYTQYNVLYHNPTIYHLKIENMGLKDEKGFLIRTVAPGAVVWIPQAYAKGGGISTVYGVAPQLQPCPITPVETMLDLPPSSWSEWITFQPYAPSRCCGARVFWLDSKQHLECFACKKVITCV